MEEKEHDASESQKERFRERGEVALSQDLTRFALLAAGCVALVLFANHTRTILVRFAQVNFSDLQRGIDGSLLLEMMQVFAMAIGPILVSAGLFAVIMGLTQSKGLFRLEQIEFKFEKLNPLPQLQKMFTSAEALVTVALSILKVTAMAAICVVTLYARLPELLHHEYRSMGGAFEAGFALLEVLTIRALGVLFLLAIVDYIHNRNKMLKKMKMSTQEMKDEQKEQMGDPKIKGKRRRAHRDIIEQRSVDNVPIADMVLVNPSHYAVAISYNNGKMGAPKVVAKGKDQQSEIIRKIARQHGVPILRQPPLTRLLYNTVKVGREIPEDLYQAVATILAHVYKTKREVR